MACSGDSSHRAGSTSQASRGLPSCTAWHAGHHQTCHQTGPNAGFGCRCSNDVCTVGGSAMMDVCKSTWRQSTGASLLAQVLPSFTADAGCVLRGSTCCIDIVSCLRCVW
jgi:hypothetical protein